MSGAVRLSWWPSLLSLSRFLACKEAVVIIARSEQDLLRLPRDEGRRCLVVVPPAVDRLKKQYEHVKNTHGSTIARERGARYTS